MSGSWRKILYGGSSDASNSGNITAVDLAVSPGSNKFLKTTSTGILSWASPSLSGDVPFSRLGIIGDTPASGAINPAAYVSDRQNTDSTIELLVNFSSAPSWVDENETVYSYDAVFCKVTNNFIALNHGYSEGETFPIFHYNMSESSFNGLFIAEALDNVFYVIRHQTSNTSTLNEAPTDFDDNEEAIDDSSNIKAWSFDEEGAVDSQYTVNTSSSLGNYFTDLSFMENLDLLQIEGVANQTTSTRYSTILDTLGGTISGPRITIGTVQDIGTASDVKFGSIKIAKNSTIELAKTGEDIPYLKNPYNTDNLLLSAPASNAIIDLSASSIELSNTLSIKNTTNKVSLSIDANMSSDLSFILPTADGADGDLLTTDGSGNLSWYTLGSDVINIGTTNLTASGARTFTIVDDTESSFSIGSATSANLLKFNTSTDTLSITGNFNASGNGSYSGNLTLLDDNNTSRTLNGNSITTGGDSGVTMYLLTGGGTYSKILVADSSTGAPKWDWITGNNISGNTIGLSKLVDIATNSFIGRDAAGTGSPGVLSATDAREILGVADGAEVNVQSDWDETDTNDDAHILNKPTVYYTSAIPDATASQTGLATSTQITKLDGIDEEAEVNPTIIDSDDLTGHSDSNVPSTSAIKAYVDNTIRDIRASGFNYSPQIGTKVYIPLGATTAENTILAGGNEWRHFVVPFDGSLEQVIMRSEQACGSTDVALHKSSTGTEVPSSTASTTVTVNMASANTSYKFDFTSNNTFSAGDIIAISFDPTNDSNDTNATVVLVYDGSQGV